MKRFLSAATAVAISANLAPAESAPAPTREIAHLRRAISQEIQEIEPEEWEPQAITILAEDLSQAPIAEYNAALLDLATLYRYSPESRVRIAGLWSALGEQPALQKEDDPRFASLPVQTLMNAAEGITSAWTLAYGAALAQTLTRLKPWSHDWDRARCGRALGRGMARLGPGRWPWRARLALALGGASLGIGGMALADFFEERRLQRDAVLARAQEETLRDLSREIASLEKEAERRGLTDGRALARTPALLKISTQWRELLARRGSEFALLSQQAPALRAPLKDLGNRSRRLLTQLQEARIDSVRRTPVSP